MWIVRLALRRPYTFVVAAMLVFILGMFTILNTPTDIFPNIEIPVVSVVFNYSGMSPSDMEQHIVTGFERTLTTTVNVIQYSASNVPILQLAFGSDTMSEQSMFDQAVNFVRPRLVTVPGIQIPYPY